GGDDGASAHDTALGNSIRAQAIARMREDHGVEIDPVTENAALSIIPRVSGFARRIHDNTTLLEQFLSLVELNPELKGTICRIARRVPTRWDSDYDCLDSTLFFKPVVQVMHGMPQLSAYRLLSLQWALVEDLVETLKLFAHLTKLFSQPDVPLIVDVYPLLIRLEQTLIAVRDDILPEENWPIDENGDAVEPLPTNPVFRVAAQASLLMIEKYRGLLDEYEIYQIAMVMCPDRKTKWF
ncbi:hypothetical protein BKA70DRAFT_1076188, partial [Coprinopsis sp. MPI-PUGE-AT-0042]